VNDQADKEMRELLDVMHGGLGSEAKDALDNDGRHQKSVAAKFGRGDDNFRHCCAIVERHVGGKDLRYVAVGLGSTPTRYPGDIRDLFLLLDDAIVRRN